MCACVRHVCVRVRVCVVCECVCVCVSVCVVCVCVGVSLQKSRLLSKNFDVNSQLIHLDKNIED